ncbi:type II secretion system protein [Fibrobacter succinogenes]|uniref:type II secretion system protein n=1 Tax=Fibrobacter succinogenes TaxID=833 RepID=UPI001569B013|nr:type II secretion system protein [Fibrobacter succinogenes]
MAKLFKNKKSFGVVVSLVVVALLGFSYMAMRNLGGNGDALLRIRGRDGAVEVAQQVLDSLKSVGVESIPSKALADTTFNVQKINRKWARGLGDSATVTYSSQVTVAATSSNSLQTPAPFELASHIYAKQVTVTVFWNFKGSKQSIEVSSVIR